jgi:hypothetical protein
VTEREYEPTEEAAPRLVGYLTPRGAARIGHYAGPVEYVLSADEQFANEVWRGGVKIGASLTIGIDGVMPVEDVA